MKRKIINFVLLLCMAFLMTSCAKKTNEQVEDFDYMLYFKNNSDTELVQKPYNAKSNTPDSLVKELLGAMDEDPDSLSYKRAKPNSVIMKSVTPLSDKQVVIDFSTDYLSMDVILEILCRAAIVKTLCQIEGVEEVLFMVEGQPLQDQNENPIGSMSHDDFVVLTDKANYTQDARFYLYFSDKKGKQLVATRVRVTYDGTKSMEQLAVEYLIQGPDKITGLTKTLKATVSEDTTLIKASTNKDGVCTVDLDEDFLNMEPGVTEEVAIYSIVNTLKDIQGVKKVQFLINGEKKKNFGSIKGFDEEFDRNLEINNLK